MTIWVDTKFGDLPVGALFREYNTDPGLCIKVAEKEMKRGNAIIVVSCNPGHPDWCQAGEAGHFYDHMPVQELVMEWRERHDELA